ncbi:MAG: radical SAM protein [Nitrospirae bacterium]|nr:radical SAM protein [Nitrospirota bacterium]
MDVCVILTYRCNSKCSMCYVWQNPTKADEEISLNTLRKIPSGIDYLNLTGGEPTLRLDLPEIVDLLYPKAMTLEISSNGLLSERLEPIIRKYPDIKIRFSLEGFGETNNMIRGERDGDKKKIDGLFRLKKLGAKDIGIATVIQDDNSEGVVELFRFAKKHGFELATSTLHNGFQFHKSDNFPYDRLKIAKYMEDLIAEMLKGVNVKNWFRAYLNMGLMAKLLGNRRMLPCAAAEDFIFIDPWSDVYACNVRPDLKLGNLETQDWDEIWNSPSVEEVREKVHNCTQNCWMVGSAKTAMRQKKYPKLPSAGPLLWVVYNKLKIMFGGKINFERYIDNKTAAQDKQVYYREFYLNKDVKRNIQLKSDNHYSIFGKFINK